MLTFWRQPIPTCLARRRSCSYALRIDQHHQDPRLEAHTSFVGLEASRRASYAPTTARCATCSSAVNSLPSAPDAAHACSINCRGRRHRFLLRPLAILAHATSRFPTDSRSKILQGVEIKARPSHSRHAEGAGRAGLVVRSVRQQRDASRKRSLPCEADGGGTP